MNKLPKISIRTASVLHALLIASQALTWASGVVPSKYQWAVSSALAIVQGFVGILQHYSPSPS